MKTKFMQAFEELEEQNIEVMNEVDMGPLQEVNADADLISDQIDEAQEVNESMGNTADVLESYGDEEAPEEVVKIASMAVEHFCNQVSYHRRDMSVSIESFGKEKGSTKRLARELRLAQETIDNSLQLANEGLLDTITKAFEMTFVTDDKVEQKLRYAVASYQQGVMRENNIDSPAWRKYIPCNKEEFTPADAVKLTDTIYSICSDDNLVKLINELADCTKALTKEIRGNWFVSNKNDIARIERIGDEVRNIKKEIGEGEGISSNYKAESFKPMNPSEQKKLASGLSNILKDDKVTQALKKQGKASTSFHLWTVWQSTFRLKSIAGKVVGSAITGGAGALAGAAIGTLNSEDISKATKANKQVFLALSGIKDIMKHKTKIANALVSYIDESVK